MGLDNFCSHRRILTNYRNFGNIIAVLNKETNLEQQTHLPKPVKNTDKSEQVGFLWVYLFLGGKKGIF